jgi:hypothetical protein
MSSSSLDDPVYNEIPTIAADKAAGSCGFCGHGDGWLGEQGDETTQSLHGAVRTGEPGDYKYTGHPNALGQYKQTIVWCGSCYRGLRHKYQRYDDTNLRALFLSTKLRLELDGIRWVGWEANDGEEREAVRKYLDDTAVHMEKLRAESDLRDMQEEQFRRYGHPPRDGWRI